MKKVLTGKKVNALLAHQSVSIRKCKNPQTPTLPNEKYKRTNQPTQRITQNPEKPKASKSPTTES